MHLFTADQSEMVTTASVREKELYNGSDGLLDGTVSVREILAYLDGDRFLTKREVSEYLNLSFRTLDKLLRRLPHYRLGSKLLFRKSEIDEWMEQFKEKTTNRDLDYLVDSVVESVLDGGKEWE